VFDGGFTLEAAGQVCAGQPLDRGAVVARLASLVDQSLVVADRHPGGGTRYRMLETLREYARERLAGDEAARLHRRHLRWFLDLASHADRRLQSRRQREWLALLDAERGNLRAALRWSLAGDEAARSQGVRLTILLWRYSPTARPSIPGPRGSARRAWPSTSASGPPTASPTSATPSATWPPPPCAPATRRGRGRCWPRAWPSAATSTTGPAWPAAWSSSPQSARPRATRRPPPATSAPPTPCARPPGPVRPAAASAAHDTLVQTLQATLGEPAFTTAWSTGQAAPDAPVPDEPQLISPR
jgi:hypothetical protein